MANKKLVFNPATAELELIAEVPADLFDLGVTDGTNGQVLSTDGAGALTFVDQNGAVDSVNGETGVVVLDKTDIGLTNVDNTSDSDKPVSSDQQAALNLKADASDVSNVDNTSDANKPVSTAQQTALNLKANISQLPERLSDLFGVYDQEIATGDYTTDAESQYLVFKNCTELKVGLAPVFKGQVIFLGSSSVGESVPIVNSDDSPIGTWEANAESFGVLVCEETDTSTYEWRIVDLKSSQFTTDVFTGDGSETDFTLTVSPRSKHNVFVTVGNILQDPTNYSVSGTTLTFTTAPLNGLSIVARSGGATDIGVPSDDTVGPDKITNAAKNEITPIGTVSAFAGASAPDKYLICNGTAISRTTYSDLYAVLGDVYGNGDGSTTFNLPDLRGEFLRGLDGGRGVDASRTLGSAQSDLLKSHTHQVQNVFSGGGTGDEENYVSNVTARRSTIDTLSEGGAETRPRNIAMNYIIKAEY